MKNRLYSIDGLRGIACICIVITHSPGALINSGLWWARDLGLCVEIFMAISGFMMAYTYKDRIKDISIGKFFFKRYFSIMPLYWVALSTYHLLNIVGGIIVHHTLYIENYNIGRIFLEYLGFYSGLWSNVRYVIYGPAWTINCLLICYIFYYIICKGSKESWQYIVKIFGALVISLATLRWIVMTQGLMYGVYDFFLGGVQLFRVSAAFFMGTIIYEAYLVLNKNGGELIGGMLLTICIIGFMIIYAKEEHAWFVFTTNDFITAATIFSPTALMAAIYVRPVKRLLESKIFLFLGQISMGIYMWHFFIRTILYAGRINIGDTWIGLAISIIGSVILGAISHYYVEPVLNKCTRKLICYMTN